MNEHIEYIEREKAIKAFCFWCAGNVNIEDDTPCTCDSMDEFLKIPAADVVEVVRCKDCKHSKPINTKESPYKYYRPECVMCYCEDAIGDEPMVYPTTHFCGFGERKTD